MVRKARKEDSPKLHKSELGEYQLRDIQRCEAVLIHSHF